MLSLLYVPEEIQLNAEPRSTGQNNDVGHACLAVQAFSLADDHAILYLTGQKLLTPASAFIHCFMHGYVLSNPSFEGPILTQGTSPDWVYSTPF